MELRTYTNIWSSQRRMYSLGDMTLPQPVPLVAAAIFILSAVIWIPLLVVIGVPYTSSIGLLFYIGVPAGLAWVGNKPIFEGKSIVQFLLSLVYFIGESKQFNRLLPVATEAGSSATVSSRVWVPDESKIESALKPTPKDGKGKRRKRKRR